MNEVYINYQNITKQELSKRIKGRTGRTLTKTTPQNPTHI